MIFVESLIKFNHIPVVVRLIVLRSPSSRWACVNQCNIGETVNGWYFKQYINNKQLLCQPFSFCYRKAIDDFFWFVINNWHDRVSEHIAAGFELFRTFFQLYEYIMYVNWSDHLKVSLRCITCFFFQLNKCLFFKLDVSTCTLKKMIFEFMYWINSL